MGGKRLLVMAITEFRCWGAVGLHAFEESSPMQRNALETCRVSPENPQGARKVFMPHIGRLWEASG